MKLRTLPDRFAIVKRADRHSVRIRTREVAPALYSDAILNRFRDRVSKDSPYVSSIEAAEAEIETRRLSLTTSTPLSGTVPDDDSAFYDG